MPTMEASKIDYWDTPSHALKLAHDRLTMLLDAELPESDHPSATRYVIEKLKNAAEHPAMLGDWRLIETLDFDPTPVKRILIYHQAFGVSLATARYGQTGVGAATHWMPEPLPPKIS